MTPENTTAPHVAAKKNTRPKKPVATRKTTKATARPASRKSKNKTPNKTPKRTAAEKALARDINAAALIDALEQHVLGETRMSATQVSAALALLKKTLPDMTAATTRTAAPLRNGKAMPVAETALSHEDALKALE